MAGEPQQKTGAEESRHVRESKRRKEPAQRIADEEASGKVGGRQIALDRAARFEQFGAQHAGQQPARQRRGDERVAALDEQAGEAAFGEEAVGVDKGDLERAGGLARGIVEGAVARLVAGAENVGAGRRRDDGRLSRSCRYRDRTRTRLKSSTSCATRMPSSA